MESLIDSMTGPASWPFWIGIGFGLLVYGLDWLMTRRSRQQERFMRKRLKPYEQHPIPRLYRRSWER